MTNIVMNIWFACVKVLFTFLHVVYSGVHYFDLTWTLFKRKWEAIFALKGIDSELYVSRFITGLEDCPSHLALIVGNDTIGCRDFTNLIIWCLAAGISFLTVYDQKGFLKEQESKFYKYFVENTSVKQNQVVFRNMPVNNGKSSNGYKNKIFVSILSCADGMDAFVELIQDFALQMQQSRIPKGCLKLDEIYDELSARSHCPDPDVAIVAAKQMCTFGFPPWSLRLTEFIRVQSLEGMSVNDFCDVLQRYSACQKRFGK